MPEALVLLPPDIADLSFAKQEDVTELLTEWEACLLDPVAALLAEIPRLVLVKEEWRLRGRATISASAMKQLRVAAGAPELLRAVEGIMPEAVEDGRLRPQATPLLLGMAVSASVRAGIGVRSRKVVSLLKSKAAA